MYVRWKKKWKSFIENKSFQIGKRLFICFVILLILYFVVIDLLTPSKEAWPIFSLKTGEFSCDTNEECIKMAREKTF